MILEQNGALLPTDDFTQYTFGGDVHYVNGFFYIPGFLAGEESSRQVQQVLEETGSVPFDQMYGAFSYCIRRANGEIFFFPCNGEMHALYTSGDTVSSSFLEILNHLRETGRHLTFCQNSVCEYCTLGKVYFRKTFVNEVSILPNDSYVHWVDGTMEVCSKGLAGIDGESHIRDPQDYFRDLAYAAGKERCTLSLTGGYDSRAVYAQLHGKVPMELFYSTNYENSSEKDIAQKVAAVFGEDVEIFYTAKPQLSDESFRRIVLETDGLDPVSLEGGHRVRSFRRQLLARGCTLQFTGDGGVLHKDWDWMQDLPFYHRPHTNLRRFYHQRIAYEIVSSNLGTWLRDSFSRQEDRFIRLLQPYVKRINTESYDVLYYYVSGNRSVSYNIDQSGYVAYAPLTELEMVRYSYHLPRGKRFFYRFLRELTSEASPEIARIPTGYGTTASNEPLYLIRDVFFQLSDYGKKAIRMVGRQLFHKTFLGDKTIDWSMEEDLRQLPLAQRAVAWAIEQQLLDSTASTQTLNYRQLVRITHLFVLADEFGITCETA